MGVEGKEGILREQVTRARHVCFGRVSGLKPLNGVTFNLPSASTFQQSSLCALYFGQTDRNSVCTGTELGIHSIRSSLAQDT